MKAVILAGGRGTRLNEETKNIPKPMVKIGGKPILWHIMKIYSSYGINEFIICCGYKKEIIENYFKRYNSPKNKENWKVTFIDTGKESMTGGRLKRVKRLISNEKFFFFTYGDGLSDINIKQLINFHLKNKKLATVTAVRPPGRYGVLNIKNSMVKKFSEKAKGGDGYINGGFFILSPKVLNLINSDKTSWEQEPMLKLAKKKQLMAYMHDGFWQSMDTYRDKLQLEELWKNKNAKWKIWN
ncbi:glucose-1-phosphate cytidylyltransferase [Candidatus Pelagibacter ubique]|nr:glucose-1-phosphate cytidylyltransferase [Candidatus Pelagibacter ubique]